MGCCGSKKPKNENCDDTPDELTGLSECDRNNIKESWAEAMPDDEAKLRNGIEFFNQLFTTYPEMQDKFENFKGKDLSELSTSPEMEAHAPTFMEAIDAWVQNVDNPNELISLFQSDAERHSNFDVGDKEFEDMENMVAPWMRSILGDRCTPEVEEAWSKLMQCHTSTVREYLEHKEVEAPAAEE